MTKQEIMDAITGCAEKLGRAPSIFEVMQMAQVSRRQIRAEFGSFTQALRECNLERATASGQTYHGDTEARRRRSGDLVIARDRVILTSN